MHQCCHCNCNIICVAITNCFSQHTKYYFISSYYKSGTFLPSSALAALYAASCMQYTGYSPLIMTTSSTSGATSAYIATISILVKKLWCTFLFPMFHSWDFQLNLAWTLAILRQACLLQHVLIHAGHICNELLYALTATPQQQTTNFSEVHIINTSTH